MASLDWSKCPAVESIPGKCSGAWVFKDTRMPGSTVFENLESGASIEEIMEWFGVTREQIVAVLGFAARSPESPPPASHRCAFSLISARRHHIVGFLPGIPLLDSLHVCPDQGFYACSI